MASTGAQRTHVRLAAALLASLLVACVVLTYLSYTSAFSPTDTVTLTAPRAGLEMDRGNKVKYRGVQIGKVEDISYAGRTGSAAAGHRWRRAALYSVQRRRPHRQQHRLRRQVSGVHSTQGAVARSVAPRCASGGLGGFAGSQHAVPVADRPAAEDRSRRVERDAGCAGRRSTGTRQDLGGVLSGLNTLTQQLNPKLPTLRQDFQRTAAVANIYADAAPDLVTVFNNTPTIARTVVDEQSNLNTALLSAIGLSNNAYDTLAPAEQNLIDAIKRLRAPLKVTADYSPEFGCLFGAINRGIQEFAPILGVRKAGLYTSSSFVLGAPTTPIRRACPGSTPPVARTAVDYPTFPPSRPAAPGTGHHSW